MQVYGLEGSMNSMGPVLLAITNPKYGSFVSTPVGAGGTMKEEFLKINPFHQVPALEHKGVCLAESGAILRYLAKVHYKDALPTDPKERGFVNWALDRFATTMYKDVVATVYPILGFTSTSATTADGKKASDNLAEFANHFLTRKFIGGDKLSIADYKVAPFFFAYTHPAVQKDSSIECPERITQYIVDFMATCKTSDMLKSANGYSVKELLDKKLDGTTSWEDSMKEISGFKGEKVDSPASKKSEERMELFGVGASWNCLGPMILAKDYDCADMTDCNPIGGDTQKADFLALNPFHAIPTLKHGDYSLAESNAILRYIAETSAPDTYDAKDATKSGLTDWAMDYAGGVLYADCYATLYPIVGYAEAPSDTREAADKVEEHLKAFVDVFLKGKFVGGDKPCIADYKVAPFFYAWGMDEVQELGITVPDKIKEFNTAFAEASTTGCDTMKALGDFIKAKLTEKKGIFSFFKKPDINKMGTMPMGSAPEQADFSGATEEPDKEEEPVKPEEPAKPEEAEKPEEPPAQQEPQGQANIEVDDKPATQKGGGCCF